ncbi:hypothetical protein FRB99_003875 [Tulasnella sp. 403]|nr:hypothetical protein FRB99_003875 [Tulasnella sp. 403]
MRSIVKDGSNASQQKVSATVFLNSRNELLTASQILTCLPRSDIVIYSVSSSDSIAYRSIASALPVSVYPAPRNARIIIPKFTTNNNIELLHENLHNWHVGTLEGYKDWAGSDAETGTYDALAHLVFSPLPTLGTSGAPVIDAETSSVVGVITGTRMYNRVAGLKGWATPAEALLELFQLPSFGTL